MLIRTLTLAAGLFVASGAALAHDYGSRTGRVVTVEPYFVISFGNRYHDGFRVLYEVGGQRYWTHSPYRPGHTIVIPPQRVRNVHHHHYSHPGWNHHDWRSDRHHWRDHHRDHHRDHRHEHRRHRN